MILLILGLILFVGAHLVPTQVEMRAGAVARFGENTYKGLFSLVAFAGLFLIIYGFGLARHAPSANPLLWDPPRWTRHATMTLMLPVFVLLAAAYLPGRISAALKHPMLVSVKLWAFAHLLVSARLANLILFGALLAWAVYDRISVKRRGIAIKSGPVRNDFIALAIGIAAYAFMVLWGHTLLIGIPLMP
ncbi:MAG: NnrU family protein [Hyphomicrobiaceae bacterium]